MWNYPVGKTQMMLFAYTFTTNLALTGLESNPGVGSERRSTIHPTEPWHGAYISIFLPLSYHHTSRRRIWVYSHSNNNNNNNNNNDGDNNNNKCEQERSREVKTAHYKQNSCRM